MALFDIQTKAMNSKHFTQQFNKQEKEHVICKFLGDMKDMIKIHPTELKDNKNYQQDIEEYLKSIDEHIDGIRNNLNFLQESNLATPKRQDEYQSNLKCILKITVQEIKDSTTTPYESPQKNQKNQKNQKKN